MLKEIIDQFYIDREKEKRRDQTRFYITDAGRCPRFIFFKFKKAPQTDMDGRLLRMFEHGDYIHRLILSSLYSLGAVRASEINIPPQEIISGRADAIITLEGEDMVLDIKSMNSMAFRNLAAPKPENVDQIQLYLHFFSKLKGLLLYVNKDTQELKEFQVDYDQPRCQTLLDSLFELKTKIDSDMVPLRIESWPRDWQCQYCQFKDICKTAGENELEWQKFKDNFQPNIS